MLMQMLWLLTISFLLFPSFCFAKSDYTTKDDKIILYKWSVNGLNYFTDKDKDDEVSRLNNLGISTISIILINTYDQDVITSTVCRTSFDFSNVISGDAKNVEEIIKKEIKLLLILKEMKNYGINKDNEIADIKGRINWLVSIWLKK